MEKLQWENHRGEVFTEETITHQHLSNIIWFMKLVSPFYPEEIMKRVETVLIERFNTILEYKPKFSFHNEIAVLHNKGYLVAKNGKYIIVYGGRVVGEVDYTD